MQEERLLSVLPACPSPVLISPAPSLFPAPPQPENRSWMANFAKAADEVGIPVCLSLALVDPATGEATETRDFHVTGPVSSRGSKSKTASSGATTGGSGATTDGASDGTAELKQALQQP